MKHLECIFIFTGNIHTFKKGLLQRKIAEQRQGKETSSLD